MAMGRARHAALGAWLALTFAPGHLTAGEDLSSYLVTVPTDLASIAAAIDRVAEGGVVEIGTGVYRESLTIAKPLTLRAAEAATVTIEGTAGEPVIHVTGTGNVRIEGLRVVGGKYGIYVTESEGVTLIENTIAGARLAGVRVRLAAADIMDNEIKDAAPPYGHGIHVSNTHGRPATQIGGNEITGNAASGIRTNMAEAIFIHDNTVIGNGDAGIAIHEMSAAAVQGNDISSNRQNAVYILDRSEARICGNRLAQSRTEALRTGNAVLVDFGSVAHVADNEIQDAANAITTLAGGHATMRANRVGATALRQPRWMVEGGCRSPFRAPGPSFCSASSHC